MSPELEQTLGVAEWLLDCADAARARADRDGCLRCTQLACRVLARQNRVLAHARVEHNIQRLAAEAFGQEALPAASGTRAACLHVLTEALGHGGHTAMAARWMDNDAQAGRHDVALLAQRADVPAALQAAVSRRGGRIHVAPAGGPFDTARWLRQLASANADRVVMHVDVDDVNACLAFGAPGGPPVMIVNHAAHIFWAGASVVDMVLNCRGSVLEVEWTRRYRRGARVGIVPIPLVPADHERATPEARAQAKAELGLPRDSLVILTIGDSYKYVPMPLYHLDFVATACRILDRLPANAQIIGVGMKEDDRWRAANEATGGRLRALGRHADVSPFHRAADLYIEGFPLGSTTALLEAGLRGTASVLAPAECPPPFGTDGVAVDEVLARPSSLRAYEDEVVQLAGDPGLRCTRGVTLEGAIRRHHTGQGWQAYVAQAAGHLPATHDVSAIVASELTPESIHEYWTAFRERCWKVGWPDMGAEELPQRYARTLLAMNLRPRVTGPLWRASVGLRAQRRRAVMPMAVLRVLLNAVMPFVPDARSVATFDDVAVLFRPGSRTRSLWTSLAPTALW